MEGCLVIALPAAGWAALVMAVALATRRPGLHLLGADAPRWGGGVAAVVGVALIAGGAALSGPTWPWWTLAAAPLGLVLTASAACLVCRDPDAGYRDHPLEIEGQPDAGALHIPPTRDGLSRPPVVLVHGGGNDRLFGLWHLVDVLTAHGHAVVTAHVAGHGRGGRDRFGLTEARRRLDAVVAAASASANDLPPVVIGQSIGAALTLDLVARARPVAGVASISAPADGLDVSSVAAVELLALLRPPIYRALRHGNTFEVLPAAGRFKRGAFPVRVGRGESYVAAFDRVVREMALPARLAASRTPARVLLVHGGRDGVIPLQQLDVLAGALADRAEVARFPRASHMDPLFDEAVIERLLRWLGDVAPAYTGPPR
jgi:alpha-beta hydrolase superfamily lysophospholipase